MSPEPPRALLDLRDGRTVEVRVVRQTLVGSEVARSGQVGGANSRTFRFVADREGEYALRFKLTRPWESRMTTPPADRRLISVTVHPQDG